VGQLAVGHGTVEQSGLLTPDLEAAAMNDTTVKKVSSAHSPTGDQGKVYPASGKRVSMRLWRDEEPTLNKPTHRHEYEVVGYVISGRAELEIEGQKVRLEPGDSWVVPAGAEHTYRILEIFTASRSNCSADPRAWARAVLTRVKAEESNMPAKSKKQQMAAGAAA
jgi:quercetin dioxygenase-like cupin family protein